MIHVTATKKFTLKAGDKIELSEGDFDWTIYITKCDLRTVEYDLQEGHMRRMPYSAPFSDFVAQYYPDIDGATTFESSLTSSAG